MGSAAPEHEASWSPWGGERSPASTRPPSPNQARPRRDDKSFKQDGQRANRQSTFGEVDSTLELQRSSFHDKNYRVKNAGRDLNSRGRRSSFSELEGYGRDTSPIAQRSASVPTMRGGIKSVPGGKSVEEESFKQQLASFKYRPNLSPRNTEALGLNSKAGFAAPCGHFPLRTNQHGFYTSTDVTGYKPALTDETKSDPYVGGYAAMTMPRRLDRQSTRTGEAIQTAMATARAESELPLDPSVVGRPKWALAKQLQTIASGAFTKAPGVKNRFGGFQEPAASAGFTSTKVEEGRINHAKDTYQRKLRAAARRFADPRKQKEFEAEKERLQTELWNVIGKPGLPKNNPYAKKKASQAGHKSLSSLEVQLTPATELRGGAPTRRSADSSSPSVSFVNRDEDRQEEARIKASAGVSAGILSAGTKAGSAGQLASFTTAADKANTAGGRRPPPPADPFEA